MILFVYALVLLLFPLQMHMMEAYAYAAAAEGYYNLSQTFALLAQGKTLPDISLYHPNHPLAHLVPGFLHRALHWDVMTVFQVRNGISALVFTCFFYLTAARLVSQRSAVIYATLLVIFTNAFWLAAISGETQIPALALVMATTYFLVRYFEINGGGRPVFLVAAACVYIAAGACHMATVMFSLPAGLSVLVYSRARSRWMLYLLVVSGIIAGFAIFYGLLFIHFLKIDSVDMYLRTLFIYYPLLVKQYTSPEWWLATGKAFLVSVSASESVWGAASWLGAIGVIVLGYGALWRAQANRAVKFLLVAWPLTQMIIQVIVNGRPDGTNFWLFLLPPFYLVAAFGFRQLRILLGGQLALPFIVTAVVLGNFLAFVLPNASLARHEFVYLDKHAQYSENPPLAMIVTEPVLTYPELWWAGSRYGLKQQKVFFPCCGEKEVGEHIDSWAAGQRKFLLLSDEVSGGFARAFVARTKLRCNVLQETKGEIRSALIPVTVAVDYPPSGRVQKSLTLYFCTQ